MARQPPGRKRRTREHVIADLGVNFAERILLECGFAASRPVPDYGIDLTVETFDENGELEAGQIDLQVKASDAPMFSADGQTVRQRVSCSDLKTWLFEVTPVVLVVYDARQKLGYWLDVEDYVRRTDLDFLATKTVSLKIPLGQTWDADAVRSVRAMKNAAAARTNRRYTDVD